MNNHQHGPSEVQMPDSPHPVVPNYVPELDPENVRSSRQPTVHELRTLGILVRDFGYESTLSPVKIARRVPQQGQLDPQPYTTRRQSTEPDLGTPQTSPTRPSASPSGLPLAKRRKVLRRKSTEPIDLDLLPPSYRTHSRLTPPRAELSCLFALGENSPDSQPPGLTSQSQSQQDDSQGPTTPTGSPARSFVRVALADKQDRTPPWLAAPEIAAPDDIPCMPRAPKAALQPAPMEVDPEPAQRVRRTRRAAPAPLLPIPAPEEPRYNLRKRKAIPPPAPAPKRQRVAASAAQASKPKPKPSRKPAPRRKARAT